MTEYWNFPPLISTTVVFTCVWRATVSPALGLLHLLHSKASFSQRNSVFCFSKINKERQIILFRNCLELKRLRLTVKNVSVIQKLAILFSIYYGLFVINGLKIDSILLSFIRFQSEKVALASLEQNGSKFVLVLSFAYISWTVKIDFRSQFSRNYF